MENLRGVSDFDPSERTTEYGNLDRAPFIGGEYYNDEDHFHEFIKFDNIRLDQDEVISAPGVIPTKDLSFWSLGYTAVYVEIAEATYAYC